ncbi:hypothetical protein GOODEAATRI_007019, partial [Goodea atripinnis]
IFARTEANTHVLAFSEGTVVPCSLSADMTLAEVTAELVKASGADSKLVMCGLTSIGHTIADTEDRGLLSICGFDLGAFNIIRNLALNLI